ncbi:hypothetical protein ANN_08100 [Periplaneta americana]|uniref:Uncharacterized protein n=1 Tax=Periplaneta americana TaxID=6978 RepID=A0ABQ8T1N3_PERAM|nr:hypothetical protein ANN_08100 [Periplaneta americana]
MAGLCEGGNEAPGSLKAINPRRVYCELAGRDRILKTAIRPLILLREGGSAEAAAVTFNFQLLSQCENAGIANYKNNKIPTIISHNYGPGTNYGPRYNHSKNTVQVT